MTTNITNIVNFDMTKELDKIVAQFRKKNLNTMARVVSVAMVDMYGAIIEDTPVGDFDPRHQGLAKANWQLTNHTPATGVINKHEPSRNKSSLRIPSKPNALFNTKWWFVNNLPYINKIEFGGYARDVKFGSYNRNTGEFEIRTSGGFSKQAPKGMFRKNLSQWPSFLKKAKRRARGRAIRAGQVT